MTSVKMAHDMRRLAGSIKEIMLTFPLYVLTRPFKGFDEMKTLNRGDMRFGVVILLLGGLVAILDEAYRGFVLTTVWQETPFVNVPAVLLFTYSPIVLFCIANWSITSITDGKGSLREIFLTYCYAMYPMLFFTLIGIVLSNVVTLNEAAMAGFFFRFGTFIQFFYLFIGLIVIHEYGFFRSILMVILTILAMLIITFVFALMFSLFGNVLMIFGTVVVEIFTHHLN